LPQRQPGDSDVYMATNPPQPDLPEQPEAVLGQLRWRPLRPALVAAGIATPGAAPRAAADVPRSPGARTEPSCLARPSGRVVRSSRTPPVYPTRRRRRRMVAGVAMAMVAALPACSGKSAPAASVGSGNGPLTGLCPATVVVQTSWYPDATHGGLYQLFGPGYRIDAHSKRVTGRLFDRGRDTGLGLEVRPGGPAVGYQPVAALMKNDSTITLGQQASEEQIYGAAQRQPTTAILSTMDQDPLVYMWDKAKHPDFNVITDVGQTTTKVLTLRSPDVSYLVGAGVLRASQLDYSYDGSPQRFMTDRSVVVGGFATNELHTYQQLGVKVGYAYVHDSGVPGYRNSLTVRTSQLSTLDGCLRQLVPVLQRAHVDFMTHPDRALGIIAAADAAFPATFHFDLDGGRAAITVMRGDGLVVNGPGQFFGSFDPARVAKEIAIMRPIYAGEHVTVPADLSADDLETGIYLDRSIRLPVA
jgi:hypothetical protein